MRGFLGLNDEPVDEDPSDGDNDDPNSDNSNDNHDTHNTWDSRDSRDATVEKQNSCDIKDNFFRGEYDTGTQVKENSGLDFLAGENSQKSEKNKDTRSEFSFTADLTTKAFEKNGNSTERSAANVCEQYDKMLKGLPSGMRDLTPGVSGACKMVETRIEMINNNNKTIGYDKYWHCMGNCRAAEYGLNGAGSALLIDSMKEIHDLYKHPNAEGFGDSYHDFEANFQGLGGGLSGQRCYDACYDRLPSQYRNK